MFVVGCSSQYTKGFWDFWMLLLMDFSTAPNSKNKRWKFGLFEYKLTAPHKFWDQSPCHHYQYCLQVSVAVWWHKFRCCYFSLMLQYWVWGRCLIFFYKVDNSRISINFSKNWLGLNNLCEIFQKIWGS